MVDSDRERAWAKRLLAAALVVSACGGSVAGEPTLVVHEHGTRTELPTSASPGRELLLACQEAVSRADNVLRLAVTPQLVEALRGQQTSIEIEYATAQPLTPSGRQGRTVTARRLLIPLSGELAGEVTTILVDPGNGYAAGPLRSPTPTSGISRLLATTK